MAMEGRIRLGWYGHGRLVKSKGDGYRVGIAVEGSLFDFELGVLETQFLFPSLERACCGYFGLGVG